jgi:hypothetical protein
VIHQAAFKQRVHTVVVIPVGPNERIESVVDTISSIERYCSKSHRVIIVDNSCRGSGEAIKQRFSEIDVVKGRYVGKFAKLYLNISLGTAYAFENYVFDVLIRMDADALVIGSEPDAEAAAYFRAHPDVGQIGVYRYDYDGAPISWWPINLSMFAQAINPLSWVLPRWNGFRFRRILMRAFRNGYPLGHNIYGGGFFLSYACVAKLYRAGVLTDPRLAALRLQEDHITSVCVYSVGMKIDDFSGEGQPVAQSWLGLPAAPEELLRRNKKLIHSLHGWRDMTEAQLRALFRERRAAPVSEPRAVPVVMSHNSEPAPAAQMPNGASQWAPG